MNRCLKTFFNRTILSCFVALFTLVILWMPSPAVADCLCNDIITLEIPGTIPEPGDPQGRPMWIDTGILVSAGTTLCLTATGQVADGGGNVTGPNGMPDLCGDPNPSFPNWYNDVAHTALIGRLRLMSDPGTVVRLDDSIDEDPCSGLGHVGETFEMTLSSAGYIELAVNDGDTGNNTGSYSVQICTTEGVVAAQKATWGAVKGLYR